MAWNSDKGGMRVIKAEDGLLLKPSEVTEIRPGDTIWIPSKKKRDLWEILSTTMTVLAQAATIIIVVDSVTR